jgi:cellobiose phosphorylase
MWPAYATLEYLAETADFGALEKPAKYLPRQGTPQRSGTILEHCLCGIERMLELRSHRGLPLIGGGDWNDGLSHVGLGGKGESVWLAMFAYGVLHKMATVLDRIGEPAKATRFRQEAASLQAAVETHGWDGDWYLAGTCDNGQPLGSHACVEGSIFLNPQTWAVISGVGSPERTRRAMAAVKERLVKPYGALLLSPAYASLDPYVGYITRYAPGLRENGGVYSHASTWAVQAFAEMGDVETAYSIYRGMTPPLRAEADADRYQAEPYVMPGNVDGPDSPFEGRAGWTWYTGSAGWMRRTALHWLLGVRPCLDGLTIAPNLPQGLGPVRLVRPFRGDRFEIELRPGTGNRLFVDGREWQGEVVPASGEGVTRKVVWTE